MKALKNIHKILLLFIAFKCNYTLAQFPPAQGPPLVDRSKPYEKIDVNTITELFKNYINNEIVPTVNVSLNSSLPGLSLSLKSIRKSNPYFSATDNVSSPNEKIIIIPYKLDYELHIPNLPNRHLLQNIKIIFHCNNWFVESGGAIRVVIDADAVYLDDPSLSEMLLNTLTLGYYTNFIDAKIKEKLRNNSGELTTAFNLGNLKCNCLGLNNGFPFLVNNAIEYQYIRPSLSPNTNPYNQTKVSLVSVRRLNAKNYETNRILYEEVENVTFEIYVNQKIRIFENITMREGQTYTAPANSIVINRPGKTESLVLIANVIQRNDRVDSRFAEYTYQQNFGHGTQTIKARKEFYIRLKTPNGEFLKPTKVLVDAYEFTFSITSPLPEMDNSMSR